jgi:hypothetical protein
MGENDYALVVKVKAGRIQKYLCAQKYSDMAGIEFPTAATAVLSPLGSVLNRFAKTFTARISLRSTK